MRNNCFLAFFLLVVAVSSFAQGNLELSAQRKGGSIYLKWMAEPTYNQGSFLIQQSLDGIIYQNIGLIEEGEGNEVSGEYLFVDVGIAEQEVDSIFYRLMVENKVEAETLIFLTDPLIREMRIYPNPACQKLNLSVDLNFPGKLTLCLIDLSGREIYRREHKEKGSVAQLTLLLHRIPQGLYQVQVWGAGSHLSRLLWIK